MFASCLVWTVLVAGACAKDAGFFFRDGDHVVFLGDSITEQKLYTTYIEAYTLTRFPQEQFTFRNVGWGGDTAWLRQRAHPDEGKLFAAKEDEQQKMVEKSVGAGLARDVLPLKPTAVTVDFGMNDHAYTKFREDIFRAYSRSQAEIVKVLTKHGARVALLTPQPIEERRPEPDKDVRNQSLKKFSDGLNVVCSKENALFVDEFDPYMAIMMKQRSANPLAFIGGGDAVHPGPAGHTLMAWAILKGLHAPSLVSRVEVDVSANGRVDVTVNGREVVQAEKCRVSNLKFERGTLSFDRTDDALPMPVDRRAEPALKLAPVLDDLNRFELKVKGLTSAHYDLTIDGEPAATVTKDDLSKGCNLATCTGPISKQAQQVLALVFKKNDVYFQRWRNVQLSGGAKSRLQELDKQISDFEAEINAARTPKEHHFELKPSAN
ncbi:MAG: SGNH/GDSL hydrolase family protein [Thermoguttaceae bacterium]